MGKRVNREPQVSKRDMTADGTVEILDDQNGVGTVSREGVHQRERRK